MISAFAKGYRVTNEKKYLDHALRAINFIETKIASRDGRLQRSFKNGISKLNAYLDDYAFYINGLLDVFEIYSNVEYLEKAILYTNFMLKHFWDNDDGNLFLTSDDHEQLIVRTKNFYDLATPSGNSIAASNLLRLYYIIQNSEYLEKAELILKAGARLAAENPFGFGQLLISMYMYIKTPLEITIISKIKDKKEEDSHQMLNWLNKQFIPNGIMTVIEDKLQMKKLQKYPFFKGRNFNMEDKPECAFVCRNFTCSLPIYSIQELKKHIMSSQ
jgi:uncharacterized protein YyaL (SSP411 family)